MTPAIPYSTARAMCRPTRRAMNTARNIWPDIASKFASIITYLPRGTISDGGQRGETEIEERRSTIECENTAFEVVQEGINKRPEQPDQQIDAYSTDYGVRRYATGAEHALHQQYDCPGGRQRTCVYFRVI